MDAAVSLNKISKDGYTVDGAVYLIEIVECGYKIKKNLYPDYDTCRRLC